MLANELRVLPKGVRNNWKNMKIIEEYHTAVSSPKTPAIKSFSALAEGYTLP